MFSKNVTSAEFAAALQAAGFDVTEAEIRDGVTRQTREEAVRVLNSKINEGGLTGGSATTTTTPTATPPTTTHPPLKR